MTTGTRNLVLGYLIDMNDYKSACNNELEIISDDSSEKLSNRIITIRGFSEAVSVQVFQGKLFDNRQSDTETKIIVSSGEDHTRKYSIPKPADEISDEDIKSLMDRQVTKQSFSGKFFRFFGWWLGFSGLYAMFAVCPFCGQQGCPVGVGGAGIVGGFFALVVQNAKLFLKYTKKIFLIPVNVIFRK